MEGEYGGFAPHPNRMQRVQDLQSRLIPPCTISVGSRCCLKQRGSPASRRCASGPAAESRQTRMQRIRGKPENKPRGKARFPPRFFSGFLGPEANISIIAPCDGRSLSAYTSHNISPSVGPGWSTTLAQVWARAAPSVPPCVSCHSSYQCLYVRLRVGPHPGAGLGARSAQRFSPSVSPCLAISPFPHSLPGKCR